MPNNTRIRRTLRIPNAEIRELYRTEIIERFSSGAVTLQAETLLYQAQILGSKADISNLLHPIA